MRYTLLDKQGTEHSIAIEADAFKKPIVRDPETGKPASYEALGYTLGFSDDTARTPHSDESTKLAQKGVAAAEKRAAVVGQTAASEPEPPKAKAGPGPLNSATAEPEKGKGKE
jgi:hypothetical protein